MNDIILSGEILDIFYFLVKPLQRVVLNNILNYKECLTLVVVESNPWANRNLIYLVDWEIEFVKLQYG